MDMETKVIKCSNCGSSLNINKNASQCKCSYCGSVNVLSKKIKSKVMDLSKLLLKTETLEGDGNEYKAMDLYDQFLQVEPQNPYVLFARALVSLMDTPDDDFNMKLFEEYFNKGLQAINQEKMEVLSFLMYRFSRYTKPSMIVWQQYAYDKLKSIDRRGAEKRMAENLLKLFDIQNKIVDLVESNYIENPSKDYVDEYLEFQSFIVDYCEDLLKYTSIYGLRYGFSNKQKIKKSIKMAKRRYKLFKKTYK